MFKLERSLVEFLGIRGYGVHLIAYVRTLKRKKIKVWIPLRSANKRIEPNKLDNTVAGGIASGETVLRHLLEKGLKRLPLKKYI